MFKLMGKEINAILGTKTILIQTYDHIIKSVFRAPELNSFSNTIRVSNRLDPDQAQNYFGPDLRPNCLQRLSADNTRRQRVNIATILH